MGLYEQCSSDGYFSKGGLPIYVKVMVGEGSLWEHCVLYVSRQR